MKHATADTSRIAHQALQAGPKLPRQQGIVVAFLAQLAWTRAEISQLTGLRLSSVCGRVHELLDLGVLEELPRRRCQITGESAHPVRIRPKQSELFS